MEENLFPTLNWEVTGLQTMVPLEHSIEGVVSRESLIGHKSSEGATGFLKELTSPPCLSQGQRSGHHRVTADRRLSHAQCCRRREQAIFNSAKLISKGGI